MPLPDGEPEPLGDTEPEAGAGPVGDPESDPDAEGDPLADADGAGVPVGEAGGDGDGAGEGDGGLGDRVGRQPGVGTSAACQVTGITRAPGQISMNADPPPLDRTATVTPVRPPRASVPLCLLSLIRAEELRADQVTGPRGAAMVMVPSDR